LAEIISRKGHRTPLPTQHGQSGVHGIADDFLGTIAEDDLFSSRHMQFFELAAESAEMIPRGSLDAVVKVALLLDPQPWDNLHDMQ
jgi:hypothetical protein